MKKDRSCEPLKLPHPRSWTCHFVPAFGFSLLIGVSNVGILYLEMEDSALAEL